MGDKFFTLTEVTVIFIAVCLKEELFLKDYGLINNLHLHSRGMIFHKHMKSGH